MTPRAIAILLLVVACGEPKPVVRECASTAARALVEGGPSASLLDAEADELAAIVRLAFDAQPTAVYCTGTVVADGIIVTAAHCLDGSSENVAIYARGVSVTVVIDKVLAHPQRDLALLFYDSPDELNGIVPIPSVTKREAWAQGARVQIAGYGDASGAPRTTVNFAVEELIEVSDGTLAVSGFGFSGACQGDSGGPLLTRTEDGYVRVAGVLEGGHDSCRDRDLYVRVDSALEWFEANAPITTELGGAQGCGRIDLHGRCYGNVSVYCEKGRLVAERCEAGNACGWRAGDDGYRCVTPREDRCQGVDDLGACADGVAVRCQAGRLVESYCELCGGECVRSPKTGRTTCYEP